MESSWVINWEFLRAFSWIFNAFFHVFFMRFSLWKPHELNHFLINCSYFLLLVESWTAGNFTIGLKFTGDAHFVCRLAAL